MNDNYVSPDPIRSYKMKLMPDWISVEEDLPKKAGVYWVCFEINGRLKSHYSVWQENSRQYKGTKWGWKSRENIRRDNIKYWMPLPHPPM